MHITHSLCDPQRHFQLIAVTLLNLLLLCPLPFPIKCQLFSPLMTLILLFGYPCGCFACQRDTKTEYANASDSDSGKDYGYRPRGKCAEYSKLMTIVSSVTQCDLDAFKLMRHSTIQWENFSAVIVMSKHCRALTTTVRVSQCVHSCIKAWLCVCVCWVFREALVINLITRVSSPTQPAVAAGVGIYGVASRIRIL